MRSIRCSFPLKDFPVTELHVGFSKGDPSSQLNGLFSSDGVHDMLQGRDYQCIDKEFHFICANVGKATGYTGDSELTKVNTTYCELVLEFYSRSAKWNTNFNPWM